MDPITLTLTSQDAAIILKQDGTFEASIPHIQADYVPDNVMLGAALVCALRNANLCNLIRENFERECATKSASP